MTAASNGAARRRTRVFLSATIASILVCIGATASAAVYQVGPTRSYKTLQSVEGLLQPGDVVELDGDESYSGGITFDRNGSSAAKIVIRGISVNGHRPIVSGGTNTIEAAGDHYVFENLELTGGSSRCFYHHADDITLRNSVVRDCPQHGILGADSDSGSLYLEHCEVFGCGDGTQKHQIYIATDQEAHPGSVFRMDHCYVHDANGGNNVKTRAERNEIRYNWIEGAEYHEIELIGPEGVDASLAREDSDVVGNVLFKRNSFYVARIGGDGTGDTNGRYRFLNNTIVVRPDGSAVFRVFDGIDSVEMHNNVFTTTGGGSVDILDESNADWNGGRMVAGNNNWVNSGSDVPSEWAGTLFGSNPGLVSIDGDDLRLTSGSQLVDAGMPDPPGCPGHPFPNPLAAPAYVPVPHDLMPTDSGLERPQSGPIDIGAFEYATSGGSGGSSGGGGSGGSSGGSGGSGGTGGDGGSGGSSGSSGGTDSGGAGGSQPSGGSGGDSTGVGGSAVGGSAGSAGTGGDIGQAGADPGYDAGVSAGGSGGFTLDAGSGTGGSTNQAGSGNGDAGDQDAGEGELPGVGCQVSGSSPMSWLLPALAAMIAAFGLRRPRRK